MAIVVYSLNFVVTPAFSLKATSGMSGFSLPNF